MQKIVMIGCLLVGFLLNMIIVSGQDDATCSDDFIESQIALMTDADNYFVQGDDGELLDSSALETLADRELNRYCDPDREPLFDVGIDIPVERWFIATDLTATTTTPQDPECFEGFVGVTTLSGSGQEEFSEIMQPCESILNPEKPPADPILSTLFLTDNLAQTIEYLSNEYNEDFDCFIGYYYVDHDTGTSINIQFFCDIDEENNITLTTNLAEDTSSRLIVRYNEGFGFDLMPLSNQQLIELDLPITPDWFYPYTNEHIDSVRAVRELDAIRYGGYPDDIVFYLFDNDRPELQTEIIFGRLERRLKEADKFVVELINQPFSDFGVNLGDLLIVQLTEYDGDTIAVYVEPYEP